jgi:hypothetical protein
MASEPMDSTAANRRTFLKRASIAAAVPAAAGLIGVLPGTADAADTGSLPDFAAVPSASFGPAPNANGYYVGRIQGNLYWVTDAYYQAMFLSTPDGVVLVDAPPTIGHNLLHAIGDVTAANGNPTMLVDTLAADVPDGALESSLSAGGSTRLIQWAVIACG